MFEKKVKEMSKKIGEESKKEFYVLIHKKHKRKVYFQNNKKTITFIRNKFNSPLKKATYSLIRIKILQLFLK